MKPSVSKGSGIQDVAFDDEFGYTDLPVEAGCPNGCYTWEKSTKINLTKEIGVTIDDTPEDYEES